MQATAMKILQTLRDHGFTALFAGGCVRDLIMGQEPGDYDIVTDASPEQVRRLFRRTVPVGEQFGICVVLMGKAQYEVAQFRATAAHNDQLKEDARHRDFTMNAMFYDPDADQIIDTVGGQQDIQRRLIRAVEDPYARFAEDRLRMMRAIRFAALYEYRIDPPTFAAIKALAPNILETSIERIRDELLKILLSPRPDHGLRLLDEVGLLAQILPEVTAMKGVQQPEKFHPEGDVFTHTLLMLRHAADDSQKKSKKRLSSELAMGVLLHDVGKPATYTMTDRIRFHDHDQVGARIAENICLRFKFSTKMTDKIVTLVQEHDRFFQVEKMRQSTLKRFLRQEHINDLLELHRLDRLSGDGNLRTYQFYQAKLQEFRQEVVYPPPLVSGKDLIQLGFTPGPIFKQVLEYVEDAQLEGTISTKKQALNVVKEIQETLI